MLPKLTDEVAQVQAEVLMRDLQLQGNVNALLGKLLPMMAEDPLLSKCLFSILQNQFDPTNPNFDFVNLVEADKFVFIGAVMGASIVYSCLKAQAEIDSLNQED